MSEVATPEVLLFHHSDSFLPRFDPRAAGRPFFTWFGDRFYELTSIGSPYVYLFLVNPLRDSVHFDSRPYHGGFHGLYATLVQRQAEFEDQPTHNRWRGEPPFTVTYDRMTPALCLKYAPERRSYEVIGPDGSGGPWVPLFDPSLRRRRFDQIPELLSVLPGLTTAYPFATPPRIDGKYSFPGWQDSHPELGFDAAGLTREAEIVERLKLSARDLQSSA